MGYWWGPHPQPDIKGTPDLTFTEMKTCSPLPHLLCNSYWVSGRRVKAGICEVWFGCASQLQNALTFSQLLWAPEYALWRLLWLILAQRGPELRISPGMNTFKVVCLTSDSLTCHVTWRERGSVPGVRPAGQSSSLHPGLQAWQGQATGLRSPSYRAGEDPWAWCRGSSWPRGSLQGAEAASLSAPRPVPSLVWTPVSLQAPLSQTRLTLAKETSTTR